MEATDDYGPEDFLCALNKVWEGISSGDEQTSIDFFILRVLQSEGSQGVTRLLQRFSQEAQGTLTVSESGKEVLHTVSREDRHQLSITTCADPDMTWVLVAVDSPREPLVGDPRHVAFYTIWEGFIEEQRSDDGEFTIGERAVFLIALLESEVMNGGLGQYLTNTDGVHLAETIACLERIGATGTRALLLKAVKLAEGAESYVAAWSEESEAFSRLDSEFLESGEDLAGLTADEFLKF